jgi:hypothetical protein
MRILGDYQAQSEKIAQAEQENKPIEVEDKHRLSELHAKLISSDVFKKFTAAQVEYIDIMRQVNDTLRRNLAKTDQAG